MEKSTRVELEMQNGTVELTLNFYELNQLRTKHKKEYDRYFEIAKNGTISDLDAVDILYVAYLCANQDKMPDVMSYEEFLQNMLNSRARVWKTYNALNSDLKN